jgi:N-methylhydantoinase A
MLLGVDVGGTFTDAVLAFEGVVITAKAPTTPRDQSEGVIAAVQAALDRAGRRGREVESFSLGMTVATNALLEGRCARTALIATEGFTDIVELGRQTRAELYRLCAARPAPIASDDLRFPAPERMTPDGPLRPLTAEAAEQLARRVARAKPESIAVVLLHSYRHPEHETMIGKAVQQLLPDAHVSLSHQVVGTFREFERAATTEVDAALSPLLAGYLRRLVDRLQDMHIPVPTIMQSNGGLVDADTAARHAAWTVLSGPAGGAVGAAFVARVVGTPDALCFDMGGTSCDVCVVDDGSVQEQSSGEIAGRPLALPMLAVHTVGAGGGSVAWRDPGGALRVGPRSAGAEPGPACYGRGGSEPTVTDANLLLGYLAPDAPLAGGVELDREAARRAIEELAWQLGLESIACAQGIVRVANAEMIRALRVVTVQRGVDPRRYALLAFGGAGPLHAAQIADELGIETIVCPRASGVLAALGLVISPRRRDVQRSVFLTGTAFTGKAWRSSESRRVPSWASATRSWTPPTSCAIAGRRSSWRSTAGQTPSRSNYGRRSRLSTKTATATATLTRSWSLSTSVSAPLSLASRSSWRGLGTDSSRIRPTAPPCSVIVRSSSRSSAAPNWPRPHSPDRPSSSEPSRRS